ncbi:Hypothetical_protein [Hexamita inflata]|uniref:Hypothetical_protein n=1 Tax=Hexamita inflata TaxID=28002 RepID=A0AA86UFY5_9EUKA|nr:Hypothetical protein HINF_LOCUS44280 [Hexamita inflata]
MQNNCQTFIDEKLGQITTILSSKTQVTTVIVYKPQQLTKNQNAKRGVLDISCSQSYSSKYIYPLSQIFRSALVLENYANQMIKIVVQSTSNLDSVILCTTICAQRAGYLFNYTPIAMTFTIGSGCYTNVFKASIMKIVLENDNFTQYEDTSCQVVYEEAINVNQTTLKEFINQEIFTNSKRELLNWFSKI